MTRYPGKISNEEPRELENTPAVTRSNAVVNDFGRRAGRRGFLPIRTNTFDRVFISIVCFVAIHLLWMRLLEAHLSIHFATAISIILAYFIITRG